ncbi:hypothetical protein [Vibrio sp. H11]|nr:hypothetical protein [Vibrio sp. H11]
MNGFLNKIQTMVDKQKGISQTIYASVWMALLPALLIVLKV